MHKRGGFIVFWIFHTGCQGTSVSQFSPSAANLHTHTLLHRDDHAYLYEYSDHYAHQHPDGCTNQHISANPDKGPYVDIGANVDHSNSHSHA